MEPPGWFAQPWVSRSLTRRFLSLLRQGGIKNLTISMHPTETWLHECHQASQAISSWQGCFIWTFPIGIISDTDFRINCAAQFVVCYQGTSIMHRSATFLWSIYQVHYPHYPIYRSSNRALYTTSSFYDSLTFFGTEPCQPLYHHWWRYIDSDYILIG